MLGLLHLHDSGTWQAYCLVLLHSRPQSFRHPAWSRDTAIVVGALLLLLLLLCFRRPQALQRQAQLICILRKQSVNVCVCV